MVLFSRESKSIYTCRCQYLSLSHKLLRSQDALGVLDLDLEIIQRLNIRFRPQRLSQSPGKSLSIPSGYDSTQGFNSSPVSVTSEIYG